MEFQQALTLWKLKDIQEYFQCGRNKALAIMQSKTFPSLQIGRVHYVAEEDVYAWVRKNRNNNILI